MHTSIDRNSLAALIGDNALREAAITDNVDGLQAQLVATPTSAEQVAQVMRWAGAAGLHVLPRGNASKISWGNIPTGAEIILETRRLNRVIEHASGDMTAKVEAGCTIADFQQALGQQKQFLAVDALWISQATVGGVIATNDTGSLRLRYGGLRDQLIGLKVVLPDGTIARSGGKVVKNVAGYDLQKLMTGALGTLGVIVEATFRLYPYAVATANLSLTFDSIIAVQKAMLSILDTTLVPTAMQIVVGSEQLPRLDLRFEGLPEGLEDQLRQVTHLLESPPTSADDSIWLAREQLWNTDAGPLRCIAKLGLLPSNGALCCEMIERLARTLRLHWSFVFQATGLGLLELSGQNEQVLLTALISLRSFLAEQEGHVSILDCPTSMKASIDVWGDAGDALALMRRVKQRFDPQAILNPGRFVGRL